METPVPLRMRTALGMMLLYGVANFVVYGVIAFRFGDAALETDAADIVASLVATAAALVPLAFRRASLPSLALPSRDVFYGAALLAVPLLVLQASLASALHDAGMPTLFPEMAFDGVMRPDRNPWLLWLTIGVVPPLCEELFFRGVLQPAAVRRWGLHGGIWLSGLIFMLGHLEPVSILSGIPFFLVVGYLAHHTRTLVPGMVVHAVNNTLVLVAVNMDDALFEDGRVEAALLAGALLAALGAISLFRREDRRHGLPWHVPGLRRPAPGGGQPEPAAP